MRSLGLHIRFDAHFESVIEKAMAYNTDVLQTFFINQKGYYIPLTPELIAHYQRLHDSFKTLYAHSSYYINLADHRIDEHPYLKKEIKRAQYLGFTHLIMHPGAIAELASKEQALDTIVRRINKLLERQKDVSLVLENSGHAKKALGGDINDLYYIRSRLDQPERVSYCIDTAHAYVYGYNIKDELDLWLGQVNQLLGDAVTLLHLNDTNEPLGSNNDKHAFIGKGRLGVDILQRCAQHPFFQGTPIILELPQSTELQEREALAMVRGWIENTEIHCVED